MKFREKKNFYKSSIFPNLLTGNSHQIVLSEMSLPGIELPVPIEKVLPNNILGRLGKENPSQHWPDLKVKNECEC